MKTAKEMWELVSHWLGNGKKMIIGGIFLVSGIIWFLCTNMNVEGDAFRFIYLCMIVGLMCFVNAMFSKLTGNNINLFVFLLINIVLSTLALEMNIDYDLQFAFQCGCFVFAWVFHGILLPEKQILKRIVMSFFLAFFSLLAVFVSLFGPIMLQMWRYGV